jgi:CheY-like chemotaxis protein
MRLRLKFVLSALILNLLKDRFVKQYNIYFEKIFYKKISKYCVPILKTYTENFIKPFIHSVWKTESIKIASKNGCHLFRSKINFPTLPKTKNPIIMMYNKVTKPIQILLVEDNPGDVRLTQEAFKDGRIPVLMDVALDGEEAIFYLQRRPPFQTAPRPDLILLDLNIPKRDGREVLEFIKNDNSLRSIPVVVLTTSSAEQDISKTYSLHVNAYINKPVDFDKFFDIVQKIEDFWLMTAILPSSFR